MTRFSSLLPLMLFAQGRYVHMGRRFQQSGAGADPGDFALFVLVLIAVALIAMVVARNVSLRQTRGFTSQRALFAELCRAHQLTWSCRRLLIRLAAHHEIAPSQLFLEPHRFQPEHVDPSFARFRQELMALEQKLFADAS